VGHASIIRNFVTMRKVYGMTKHECIKALISLGYLKSPLLIKAFQAIDRSDFIPGELKEEAYADHALPIGYDQTISAPVVVAFMLEHLEPKPGQKILDIGSGSGWTTALLSYVVGKESGGKVFAIERIPELKIFGEANCAKYNFVKSGVAQFITGDGFKGLPREAPFDRIQAAAVSADIPESWKYQLKLGGFIVAPVAHDESFFGDRMRRVIRESENKFKEEELPGLFAFVPLIEG